MSEIDKFLQQINDEVMAEASNWDIGNANSSSYKEDAFTKLVSDDLSIAGILESPVVCHHEFPKGNGIAKVNAYGVPEEDSRLDIVISDYRTGDEIEKISQAEIEKKFLQGTRFIESCLDSGYKSLDPSNDVYDMMKTIYDLSKSIDRVNIVLATNALSVSRKDIFPSKKVKHIDVTHEIWDIERYRRFRMSGASQEPLEVDIKEYEAGGIPCVFRALSNDDYLNIVAIVPGKLLYSLYDKYGSRLLELNVRSYLQARGKINQGILNTLVTEPEKFLTYNNGITIVAEGVEFNAEKTCITAVNGMQIVNGGQTTASIHRAVKDNKAPIDNVYVQAKITIVPPEMFEDVVPLISKYSNTQNKVSEVDLRANHPFHVGLERVAKKTWIPGETSMWFYERARGGYQTERAKASTKPQKAKFDATYPVNQKITKEDVARYINTWNGLPHTVSKGGQKNFSKFMEGVGQGVGKDWEPSSEEYKNFIAKAIFYRAVQKIAKEENTPAFRINIVNYTASLLIEKSAKRINLKEIWDRQALSDELEAQIREWVPRVQELLLKIASGLNPSTVFKEESCWKKVKNLTSEWKLDTSFSKKLVSVASDTNFVNVEVENNMARCMELSAPEWLEIAMWGKETQSLEVWQIGIANTLAGYATMGWEKKPSEKQASHGFKIVTAFKERSAT
jgi:hypothetical protein